jgi:signal transduction histidine kinase
LRRPIRIQLLIPFSTTLLIACAVIAATSAWLAVRRAESQTLRQIQNVVETLAGANLTYTRPILDKMRGLSGAHFVALDRTGRPLASTLADSVSVAREASTAPLISVGSSLTSLPSVETSVGFCFAARVRADGAEQVSSLLVLYPESNWQEARRAAIWPPLVIGTATLIVMAGLSAWLAARFCGRIGAVQTLLARIADGEFPDSSLDGAALDEIDDLVLSAGRLSRQLQNLQQTIQQTERVRLLAQLAGGLAHQLRNAVTGARMAVQLHQKRCSKLPGDDTLTVALRQLELTEEQVRGLLSLSHRETTPAQPAELHPLLNEVIQLVRPQCDHAHVDLQLDVTGTEPTSTTVTGPPVVCDAAAFRTATLNLILNAIEATGPGGEIRVVSLIESDRVVIEIFDNGPGPSDAVRDTLFEPFVTSRAEGAGLGLALATQSAESLGGSLSWNRREDWTVFRLEARHESRSGC